MKLFYDHLIVHLQDVYAEIESLEVTPQDKNELRQLVEEATHHTVLDTILKHLDKQHHSTFLDAFHQAPHDDTLLDFLKDKVEDIELKIVTSLSSLKHKLLRDLSASPKSLVGKSKSV